MKKIISIFIAVALALSAAIPVYATESTGETEVVLKNGIARSSYSTLSISDIDQLVEERNQAYLLEDHDAVNQITNELYANGMDIISLNELNALTGEENTRMSRGGAIFETVFSTYATGGKNYDIMRVYATPTTSCRLYMTGVTAVRNSASAKANAMSFINITAHAIAGLASNTIGVVQTVYGAISSVVSILSPTTTIKSISSSYTWNVAETCVFVYIKSPVTDMWIQGAQYGKASSSVAVVTPTLTYGTNGAIASSVTKTYNGTATPTNYNSTAKAFDGFLGRVYTDAKVSKIIIKGIEGKTVKTVNLLNPDIPAMIDY